MRITPLEIRQKTFEKVFRGLDKDEVQAFLNTLSHEWEKIVDENKELRIKLETSQKEVEKLREVENSLFKTLKTAEDTGASMIDQATKAAELHLKETEMKADALMSEAKHKAKDMVEEADMKSRQITEEMEDRLRSLAQVYRTLENVRDDLISDIKTYATESLDKVNRVKSQIKSFDVEAELIRLKREASEVNQPKPKYVENQDALNSMNKKSESDKQKLEETADQSSKDQGSFFDEID